MLKVLRKIRMIYSKAGWNEGQRWSIAQHNQVGSAQNSHRVWLARRRCCCRYLNSGQGRGPSTWHLTRPNSLIICPKYQWGDAKRKEDAGPSLPDHCWRSLQKNQAKQLQGEAVIAAGQARSHSGKATHTLIPVKGYFLTDLVVFQAIRS